MMWNFIKYSFIGFVLLIGLASVVTTPEILAFFLLCSIPFCVGKLYVNRRKLKAPTLDDCKKEVFKKPGQAVIKFAFRASSLTFRMLIIPLFKMIMKKLAAKKEFKAQQDSVNDKKTKDNLKKTLKKKFKKKEKKI